MLKKNPLEIINIIGSDSEGIEKLEERILLNSAFEGIRLSIRHYQDLKVWQKAYQLCLEVYRLTREFPKEERYGLTSQVRRASMSILTCKIIAMIIQWSGGQEIKWSREKIEFSYPLDHSTTRSLYGVGKNYAFWLVSNIAEGCGRGTTAEFIRSNYISYGSLCELETQILLCCDLGYIKKEKANELQGNVREVERMLKSLISSLEKKISST